MADDLLMTGDFSKPEFILGEYVEESKLEGKARIAAKEGFLDDKKAGIRYSSPMKKGTFELNKNYESLHTGDLYQVPGKRECKAKLAAKAGWLDEKKAGIIYSNPSRKSATPGDRYGSIAQVNIEAFPPFGTYPKRGVREKVDVEDLKDHRNILVSPSKRGMGGYVGYPGVLMNPFPEFVSGDKYDAAKVEAAADNAAHKEAQAKVDEKCVYLSGGKGVALFSAKPQVLQLSASDAGECIIGPESALDTVNPKERAQLISQAKPWEESGDKTWRHAQPTKSWRYATINKFPDHMPDKYDDKQIRESQTPMRRMGWHRHEKAGLVSDGIKDRKPFKPSTGVGHTKLSTTIMFKNMRV